MGVLVRMRGPPSRYPVAVRTLIEWTSNDPDREGFAWRRSEPLVRTRSSSKYRIDPIRVLQPSCEQPNK